MDLKQNVKNLIRDIENNTNLTSSNPKTGDNIVTFVAMFIVSVLGIAITVKYKKNKVAKKH